MTYFVCNAGSRDEVSQGDGENTHVTNDRSALERRAQSRVAHPADVQAAQPAGQAPCRLIPASRRAPGEFSPPGGLSSLTHLETVTCFWFNSHMQPSTSRI